MAFKGLRPIEYGGREVWPLIEGGKGVSATNHLSSGAWAAAGGIGTVSAVNADTYDSDGNPIPQVYPQTTRKERFEQLVRYAIDGATEQVKRAHEIAGGKGAININVLWEMGGAQQVLEVGDDRGDLVGRVGGLEHVGADEVVEVADHPWFVACQFHPEFTSDPRDGHPLFTGFIEAAMAAAKSQ